MRLPSPTSLLLVATLPVALVACNTELKDVGETTDDLIGSDGDTSDTAGDTAGDTAPTGPATTGISGRVRVELYNLDADGVPQPVTFEDAWGGTFPYGAIFVGAYTDRSGDGIATDWHATTYIAHPSIEGDAYSFDVTLPEGEGDVYLYAQLDERGDGILASTDPSGVRSEAVRVTHGGVATDADIVIMVNATPQSGGGGGGGGDWGGEWGGGTGGSGTGGGGGGEGTGDGGTGDGGTGAGGGTGTGGGTDTGSGSTDCSSISGTAQIPTGWDAGESVVTMLYDATGYGPYKVGMVRDMAITSGTAAQGTWSMNICEDYGGVRLLGAYDSNANGLIDPSDIWGGYAWASGMDGNPILVNRRTTLTGLNVLLPFNGGRARDQGVTVSPLVRIEGDLSMSSGGFASLPAGTQVHVVASRYVPGVDVSVSSFSSGYDFQTFVWSEIDGQTSLPYTLVVPSNTTMYLWAYADTDGDRVVNEVGEPMATGGTRAGGEIRTGTSTSNYDLGLIVPAR